MLGMIRNLKLQTKLFWGYCLVLAVPLTIGGLTAYVHFRTSLETHLQEELEQTTQYLYTWVQSTVRTTVKARLAAIAEKNKEIVTHFYYQARQGAYYDGGSPPPGR